MSNIINQKKTKNDINLKVHTIVTINRQLSE
jgi:hypothetical protein